MKTFAKYIRESNFGDIADLVQIFNYSVENVGLTN